MAAHEDTSMHARGSSQLNQSMQALSACVDDCPQATPVRVTTKPFAVSRRRKRPREEDEALSIILKESSPFSTVTLSLSWRNMAPHTDWQASSLCASQHQQSGTSHARGTVSAGYSTTTPEAKLYPAGLALPRGDCLRGRNRWRVLGRNASRRSLQALEPGAVSKRMLL